MPNPNLTPNQQDVIQTSVNNPGALVTGAPVGTTGGDGLMNEPTTFQAATGVKSFDKPAVPLVSPSANPNVLSADTAKGWVSGVADTLVDRSQPVFNLLAAHQDAEKEAARQLAPEAETNATNQRSADLTGIAGNVKTGLSGTDAGNSALDSITHQHQLEQQAFQQKMKDLTGQILSSSASGAISATVNKQQQLQQLDAQSAASSSKALQDQLTQLNINEKLGSIQQTNQTNASSDLNALMKSGTLPTQAELNFVGIKWGVDPVSMAMLAGAAASDQAKAQAKDAAAAQTAGIDAADKLHKYLDSRPLGEPVAIGDYTYYGTGKGDIKSGVQVDKSTGQGLYYEYNPATHITTTTPMGQVGFNDPNWQMKVDAQGNLWRVSLDQKKEEMLAPGQAGMINNDQVSLPMTPGAVQKTNAATYPDGTTGPTLPGHEANAGQCGAAVNYWYGQGLLPDSYGGKQTALASYKVEDPTTIQSHDTFLMKSGSTGHVGVVGDIYRDPKTGKEMFTATESNYVPPGQGLLSNTRVMAVDDPRITMFARVPTPNLPPAGGDSRVTLAASGSRPNFNSPTATDNTPNKVLTAPELKAYMDIAPGSGVRATDTNAQAQTKVSAWQTANPGTTSATLTDSQLTSYTKIAPGAGVLATDNLQQAQQKVADWQKTNGGVNSSPVLTDTQFKTYAEGAPGAGVLATDTLDAAQKKVATWQQGGPTKPVVLASSPTVSTVGGRPNFGAAATPEKQLTPAEFVAYKGQAPEAGVLATDKPSEAAQKVADWQTAHPNALNEDQENAAQQLSHYRGNINDFMKGRTQGEAEAINRRASEIAASEGRVYDPKIYDQQQQTVKDFATDGTSGQAVQAATKVLDHLAELKASADTVNAHRGFSFQPQITRDLNQNIPLYSAAGDVAARLTHTAGDLNAYNENGNAVAEEMNKVFSATGGSLAQVQSWKENVDDTNTASENHSVIQKSIDLLGGQLKGMLDNYQRVMEADPAPFLKPADVKQFKDMGFDTSKLERYTLPAPPLGQMYVKDKNGNTGMISRKEFDPNVFTAY